MGKLVYSMMVSLDGFIATPDGSLDWVRIDEELHRFSNEQARQASAFLYGRRLYEAMAAYWPFAHEDPAAADYMLEFAEIWRPMPKIVYSRTLESAGWNGRIEREVAADEIERLKAEGPGELQAGGAGLGATLIGLGLVDEYQPIVQPVAIGAGTPYLPAGVRIEGLRLLETRTFQSGAIWLRYAAR